MTLEELSTEYRKSAKLICERLHSLREQLKHAENPEDVFNLKRRIAELTPILTELNKIAQITAHYYERGFWRDAEFTSNCFSQRTGQRKTPDFEIFEANHSERTDGCPAGYVHQIPPETAVHYKNSRGNRRKQKHCKPQSLQSGAKDCQVQQISELTEDALLKVFFG